MPVTIDVGDRSAELGIYIRKPCYAACTGALGVGVDAQREPDPVSDIEPV